MGDEIGSDDDDDVDDDPRVIARCLWCTDDRSVGSDDEEI